MIIWNVKLDYVRVTQFTLERHVITKFRDRHFLIFCTVVINYSVQDSIREYFWARGQNASWHQSTTGHNDRNPRKTQKSSFYLARFMQRRQFYVGMEHGVHARDAYKTEAAEWGEIERSLSTKYRWSFISNFGHVCFSHFEYESMTHLFTRL